MLASSSIDAGGIITVLVIVLLVALVIYFVRRA